MSSFSQGPEPQLYPLNLAPETPISQMPFKYGHVPSMLRESWPTPSYVEGLWGKRPQSGTARSVQL